jgi:endo-alpha-1,4-polygalactosaminidase (GH114 family)
MKLKKKVRDVVYSEGLLTLDLGEKKVVLGQRGDSLVIDPECEFFGQSVRHVVEELAEKYKLVAVAVDEISYGIRYRLWWENKHKNACLWLRCTGSEGWRGDYKRILFDNLGG